MILKNPPVIQTWIGFNFEAGSDKPRWELSTASAFLARYGEELPHSEAIFETQYQIQDISIAHRPQIVSREVQLDKARARNAEGTHWLQLADNLMVYNQTKGEVGYLGFAALRDAALDKLDDYLSFFRPSRLISAELHYVDMIEIPIPPDGKIDLEEYFHLRVESPPSLGLTWHFAARLFLRPRADGDILEVRFQSEPPKTEGNAYRFRIDWHMACTTAAIDRKFVAARLDGAHECLLENFKASVTDKTWQLFQPSDEG